MLPTSGTETKPHCSEHEVEENIKRITEEVEEAKIKSGRENETVRIMAVTKTVPAELVNCAVRAGITLLGENRVQEYVSKRDIYLPEAEVHFIGHLQTNKVKRVAGRVSMVQSVDSLRLAAALDAEAKIYGRVLDVLAEVNIGGEASKGGAEVDKLAELLTMFGEMRNIKVKGLMCIPPAGDNERYFDKMQQLYLDISSKNIDNIDMSVLSMGMSGDFATAVRYGSNLVRIGTRLFGARS